MNQEFLKYYFEKESYLQNLPMNMKKFIKFCKKRGIDINKDILEDLEKKKIFYPIFRVELILEEGWGYAHPASNIVPFLEVSYKQNKIFLPQESEFVPFSKYYDKKYEEYKVYSYYSTYQIYQLDLILNKKYSKQHINTLNKMIDLLIGIQIYSPYGRTNMRLITIKDIIPNWRLHLKNFNLEEVLKLLEIDEEYLFECYKKLCGNLKSLLGSNDMIQLWKYVDWKKKDECIGKTRLGIEYLEWALMLKRCIENHIDREIYDVDEVNHISLDRIINEKPSEEKGQTLRGVRNKNYYNEINETYEFNLNRKKLFYLSNLLTLDYHPRIILLVEGKTEEKLIPKFYNEFYGNFEDSGFEIINICGIANFFSGQISDRQPNGKYLKLIVSNFANLIKFNLKTWQAIPFFVGDNENDIVSKLQEGHLFDLKDLFYLVHNFSVNEYEIIFKYLITDFIKFLNEFESEINFNTDEIKDFLNNNLNKTKNLNSSLIDDWTYIWKLDFELDNFKPEELQNAIKIICNREISLEKIQDLYVQDKDDEKMGIKKLGDDVDENKIAINEKLLENLVKHYETKEDYSIFERPILKLLEKLHKLEYKYDTPKNTLQLLSNQKRIYSEILDNN